MQAVLHSPACPNGTGEEKEKEGEKGSASFLKSFLSCAEFIKGARMTKGREKGERGSSASFTEEEGKGKNSSLAGKSKKRGIRLKGKKGG